MKLAEGFAELITDEVLLLKNKKKSIRNIYNKTK